MAAARIGWPRASTRPKTSCSALDDRHPAWSGVRFPLTTAPCPIAKPDRKPARDEKAAESCPPRRRLGNALSARDEGDGQGDASGRGQAADPIRDRGGA